MNIKKIAFFGTPDFTVDFLNRLDENGFCPSLIVTNPDSAKGRNMIISSPAPKIWAIDKKIPVLQPEKIGSDFIEEFKKHQIELGVVVAYGKILPQELLNTPKHGMINVHYSLLPKYRGATPVESAILSGDSRTGVTIQKIIFKLDSGDIIRSKEIEIRSDETTPELRNRLNIIALDILPSVIDDIFKEKVTYTQQDDSLATSTRKIKKEDGLISLSDDSELNFRKYRAYFGWPGTYFFTNNGNRLTRVIVKKASFNAGVFEIETVVPEGKSEISYKDFVKNLLKNS